MGVSLVIVEVVDEQSVEVKLVVPSLIGHKLETIRNAILIQEQGLDRHARVKLSHFVTFVVSDVDDRASFLELFFWDPGYHNLISRRTIQKPIVE